MAHLVEHPQVQVAKVPRLMLSQTQCSTSTKPNLMPRHGTPLQKSLHHQ